MPHLSIEYTTNTHNIRPQDVLDAALVALDLSGLFDMSTAKGRVLPLDRYAVNSPDDATGYVAATLRMLPGRSHEERREVSAAVSEAIAACVGDQRTSIQITTEVVEIDALSYTKWAV